MKKVFWIAGWYPNLLEPLTGDFIERHAIAASKINNISVLFIRKDHLEATPGNVFKETRVYNETARATLVYYKVPFAEIKWIHGLLSAISYVRLHLSAFRSCWSDYGKPDLVHVHVSLKAGIIALLILLRYKIPYVVSEQWTGFCKEAIPNFSEKPFITRMAWKIVMKNASGCTAVSGYLGDAMRQYVPVLRPTVIPNVVDTEQFLPLEKPPGPLFRFIHISTLGFQKNPEVMLEAVGRLAMSGANFTLEIYGPRVPEIVRMVAEKNLEHLVFFHGEVAHPLLVKEIQRCDALVLYSRFETFGCVIIEANACGLPVVVSDLPVFHENVFEGINGVFAGVSDPGCLAEKMGWLIQNRSSFDAKHLHERTKSKYSYPVVASAFDTFYQKILSGRK